MSESDSEEEYCMEPIIVEQVKNVERVSVSYTESELEDIKDNKDRFSLDIKKMKKYGTRFYLNHIDVSNLIVKSFEDGKIVYQLVVARTQSGKTAAMLKTIELFIEKNVIDIENIYIITGLSSVDWITQTKKRFPECMHKRIFHNGQLDKEFKNHIKDKKNCLVLIDEAQLASKKNQTFDNVMTELGWNMDFLLEYDIKIVQFSATPDGILYAYKKWPTSDNYAIHYMKTGEGYFGTKDMKERKQLRQCKRISFKTEKDREFTIHYLSGVVKDIISFPYPRYHFIRTNSKNSKDNYTEMFKSIIETQSEFREFHSSFCFESSSYSMDGDILNLESLLEIQPDKHTFIFVKEKLKCADTIVKRHIGVMLDRYTKNDSFTMQSLLGRACGYEPHDIIVYTNLDSIKRYDKMIEYLHDKDKLEKIVWNSGTTKHVAGQTTEKNTYNRFGTESKRPSWDYVCEEETLEFNMEEAYLEYIKDKNLPISRAYKKNFVDGFYHTSTTEKGVKKYDYLELHSKIDGFTKGKGAGFPLDKYKDGEAEGTKRTRLYVCYKNVEDPATTVFILRICKVLSKRKV